MKIKLKLLRALIREEVYRNYANSAGFGGGEGFSTTSASKFDSGADNFWLGDEDPNEDLTDAEEQEQRPLAVRVDDRIGGRYGSNKKRDR